MFHRKRIKKINSFGDHNRRISSSRAPRRGYHFFLLLFSFLVQETLRSLGFFAQTPARLYTPSHPFFYPPGISLLSPISFLMPPSFFFILSFLSLDYTLLHSLIPFFFFISSSSSFYRLFIQCTEHPFLFSFIFENPFSSRGFKHTVENSSLSEIAPRTIDPQNGLFYLPNGYAERNFTVLTIQLFKLTVLFILPWYLCSGVNGADFYVSSSLNFCIRFNIFSQFSSQ